MVNEVAQCFKNLFSLHSATQQLVVQPSHLHRQNLLNAVQSHDSKTENDNQDTHRRAARQNFDLLKADPLHLSLHFKKVGKCWSACVSQDY